MSSSAIPLTLKQLQQCTYASEENSRKYLPFIQGACKAYDITSKERLAAFLSQLGHESANLSHVVENLNYSASGLYKTWPSRFSTLEQASAYHRKPEKIANKVYSSRMGNGDEKSEDGWRYRGRGLIQITGKYNYELLSKDFDVDFIRQPDLLLSPVWASLSAGWFWDYKKCNSFADSFNIEKLTRLVNGGVAGLKDRYDRYDKALTALVDYKYE